MDTTFMNSENSRTSEYYVLIRSKKRPKKRCFITPLYLLYMEKRKKLIQ